MAIAGGMATGAAMGTEAAVMPAADLAAVAT
jgi:hypothetical protein